MKKNCDTNKTTKIISWILTAWIAGNFLMTLPYKFTNQPETQHIFGTIGGWLKGIVGQTIGENFAKFGGYIIGSGELLTSIILLLPILNWWYKKSGNPAKFDRKKLHSIGGIMTSAIMGGAIFFHLFSPLKIDLGDGGALFYTAVISFFAGIIIFVINRECA